MTTVPEPEGGAGAPVWEEELTEPSFADRGGPLPLLLPDAVKARWTWIPGTWW